MTDPRFDPPDYVPQVMRVEFDWQLENSKAEQRACTIHYLIDRMTKTVYEHGVRFHYGYNDNLTYVAEMTKEVIRELEGFVTFEETTTIE